MLKQGDIAPQFSTPNQNNETVNLSDYAGHRNVVLYFYPKDDTPGCTIEANDFTAYATEFNDADTIILGVSKDDCDSHKAFINKFSLTINLLADTDGTLCEAYDTWQLKTKNDVSKMGIVRSTFIIDKTGVIQYAEYGVNPDSHAKAMLEKVKAL